MPAQDLQHIPAAHALPHAELMHEDAFSVLRLAYLCLTVTPTFAMHVSFSIYFNICLLNLSRCIDHDHTSIGSGGAYKLYTKV